MIISSNFVKFECGIISAILAMRKPNKAENAEIMLQTFLERFDRFGKFDF